MLPIQIKEHFATTNDCH